MSYEMNKKNSGAVALMTIPVLIEVGQDIQACFSCVDWPLTIAGAVAYVAGMRLLLLRKGD